MRSGKVSRALPMFDSDVEPNESLERDVLAEFLSNEFGALQLTSRTFVATSHADAALTYTSLASSTMAARAREVMRLSPASHQRKASVIEE
jgi:hypothetical protein